MSGERLCRSCGAPILWSETLAGSRMPLDRAPLIYAGAPAGMFLVIDAMRKGPPPTSVRWAVSISSLRERGMYPHEGTLVYRSHFASCPNAGEHRAAA